LSRRLAPRRRIIRASGSHQQRRRRRKPDPGNDVGSVRIARSGDQAEFADQAAALERSADHCHARPSTSGPPARSCVVGFCPRPISRPSTTLHGCRRRTALLPLSQDLRYAGPGSARSPRVLATTVGHLGPVAHGRFRTAERSLEFTVDIGEQEPAHQRRLRPARRERHGATGGSAPARRRDLLNRHGIGEASDPLGECSRSLERLPSRLPSPAARLLRRAKTFTGPSSSAPARPAPPCAAVSAGESSLFFARPGQIDASPRWVIPNSRFISEREAVARARA
jgi:hypothetical protein